MAIRLTPRRWGRTAALMTAALILPAVWTKAAPPGPKTRPTTRAHLKGKTFYAWGVFDVDGNGRADDEEQSYVEHLLWDQGAQTARTIVPEVNVIVIGRKPARPAEPGKGADLVEELLYKAKLKAWRNSD